MVDFSNGNYTAATAPGAHLSVVIEKCSSSVLIIDGITKKFDGSASEIWWGCSPSTRRLIYVSSLQFGWGQEDFKMINMQKLILCDWELEEYYNACTDQTFFEEIKEMLDTNPTESDPKEMINSKYNIAGASARWMFALNSKEAIQDITYYVGKAADYEKLIAGLTGESSSQAVNHLVSYNHDNRPSIVSQLVCRYIGMRCDSKFIVFATNMSPQIKNGSLDGHIFQMDFLNKIVTAAKLGGPLTVTECVDVVNDIYHSEYWHAAQQTYKFFHLADLDSKLPPVAQIPANTWLIPVKVTQACYDALCLVNNVTGGFILRVVQLTVAAKHGLLMAYVRVMVVHLQSLNIPVTGLEVAIVVPKTVYHTFTIGNVTNHDNATIKALGWKKENVQVLLFRRANEI